MNNIEIAIVIDEQGKKHEVYGTWEEVERYADSIDGWVDKYLDHLAPCMVQSNYTYIVDGHDPYQKSRGFSYEQGKVIDIIKW